MTSVNSFSLVNCATYHPSIVLRRFLYTGLLSIKVVGFFADIYRLLGKYSLLDFLKKFENDGEFVSKYSWKRIIRASMQLVRDAEWNRKCVNSANANSIIRIKEFNREYVFWEVSRAFPKYYSLIQKAVRMLGIMFSGLRSLPRNCVRAN